MYWTDNSCENWIIFNLKNNDTIIILEFSSIATIAAAASSLLEIKLTPEMGTKQKRDNNRKSNDKQTKASISKRTPSSMST